MPNPLTGDFDVVAQVGRTLVHSVLAAQHQEGTYLHAFSCRVNDPEAGVRGEARVQVSVPSVELADGGAMLRIAGRCDIRARILPAADSVPVPEVVHGDVRLTASVERLDSGGDPVIAIDLAGAEVAFTPAAGSGLTAAETTMVERLVRRFVQTGFEPVNTVVRLPPDGGGFPVRGWQFRTLPGPTMALLLTLRETAGPTDPGSVTRVLVRGDDELAVAVAGEFLIATLRERIREELARLRGQRFEVWVGLLRVTYVLHLDDPRIALRDGALVVGVSGRVTTTAIYAPDFDFRVEQAFALRVEAGTLVLDAAGEPRVTASWIVRREIERRVRAARDEIVRRARRGVADMVASLTDLLTQLRVPDPRLVYTGVEIGPDGVVARGRIELPPWAEVLATYETKVRPEGQIEMDAFKSWVPGGVVRRYRWVYGSERVVVREIVEAHRFFTEVASMIVDSRCVWPPCRWCLEVWGVRDGREVSSRSCDIMGSSDVGGLLPGARAFRLPIEVPDASGEVIAHADVARAASASRPAGSRIAGGNMLVYFAGSSADAGIVAVREAVAQRSTPARFVAALVVIPPGGAGQVPRQAGDNLAWAEDVEGTWARAFGVTAVPAAFLVHAGGVVAWAYRGALDRARLDDALERHQATGFAPPPAASRVGVRAGAPAPDFLFEHAPGHRIALRRFRGRRVVLLFWTSWSSPALAELGRLARGQDWPGGQETVALAINDGEDPSWPRQRLARSIPVSGS